MSTRLIAHRKYRYYSVTPLPHFNFTSTNLAIHGEGSGFIYHDCEQPFTIGSGAGITIENVNIKWHITLTAQAQVLAATGNYIGLALNTAKSPSPQLITVPTPSCIP